MKRISINTVQGIGDIFWAYQKLSPFFDQIDFNVLILSRCPIQQRAQAFLKLIPKIGSVTYRIVKQDHYNRLAKSTFYLQPILDNPYQIHDYACNYPLEEGIRLEDIDPGKPVDWNIPLHSIKCKLPFPEYIMVYVSGSKPDFTWEPKVWANLVEHIRPDLPIVFVGADYDMASLNHIAVLMSYQNRPSEVVIGTHPGRVVHLMKHAAAFVGYQSGLSVIADNLRVPQVMMYFPFLTKMMNTWCQPTHKETGIFNAFTFDRPVMEVISEIPRSLKLG